MKFSKPLVPELIGQSIDKFIAMEEIEMGIHNDHQTQNPNPSPNHHHHHHHQEQKQHHHHHRKHHKRELTKEVALQM